MKLNSNKILLALFLLLLSLGVFVFATIINDKLFLQELRTNFVYENLNSVEKHIEKSSGQPISIDVEWPIESIMFFYGAMCFYWYFAGNLCRRIFRDNPYRYGIPVAIVSSLFFSDLAMPLYILNLSIGIRWSLFNRKQTGTKIIR